MNDFDNRNENYLYEYRRTRLIKYTVSITVAVLILIASVVAALLVNARTHGGLDQSTPDMQSTPGTTESNTESDTESVDNSENETSDTFSDITSGDESVPEQSQGDVSTDSTTSDSETSEDTSGDTSDDTSEPVLYGVTINGIYVYGDIGLQYFGSSTIAESKFASAINSYRDAFDSGVNMYSILVPTYSEFYEFKDGRTVGQSQKESIERVYSKLSDGITTIDIVPALSEHSEEYIYFRTDTNWTPLGAYYAYSEFIQKLGDTPIDLSEYEVGKIDEFVGSSYTRSNAKQLLDNPDYLEFYRVDKKFPSNVTQYFHDGTVYKNSQLVFKSVSGLTTGYQIFGADTRYITVKTTSNTGRKLLVFRDLSGAPFIPFLVPHFDEIYAVDTRYFADHTEQSIQEFTKELGITDVLFLYYTTSANNGVRINEISELLSPRNNEN